MLTLLALSPELVEGSKGFLLIQNDSQYRDPDCDQNYY